MMSSELTSLKVAARTGGVRFAPSPTGRFHLGNLRTAWISHEFARVLELPWIVRFEDIDQPRVLAGAQELQLTDMASLGLVPERVLVQSEFRLRHFALFSRAVREGQIYPCDCSRKEVQQALSSMASASHEAYAPVYSGTCRDLDSTRSLRAHESIAWRFRMPQENGHEDFIVARSGWKLDSRGLPAFKSFTPAYHWACAIDDFDGGYDLLVRSADLATALPLQRAIQEWLERTQGRDCKPAVFHTSLVTRDDGQRLEKRTQGVTLPELLERGETTNSLLLRFRDSFDPALISKTRLSAGETAGEARATLRLSDLGLGDITIPSL